MEKIYIGGRIGNNAEVKENLNAVTFNVATNRKKGSETVTTWYRVFWKNYNQKMVQYLKKGSSIMVSGDLAASTYTSNSGSTGLDLTIYADAVNFPDFTGKDSGTTQTNQTQQTQSTPKQETVVKPIVTQVEEPQPQIELPVQTQEEDLPF